MEDVASVIQATNNSAPGPGDIHTVMLKDLHPMIRHCSQWIQHNMTRRVPPWTIGNAYNSSEPKTFEISKELFYLPPECPNKCSMQKYEEND